MRPAVAAYGSRKLAADLAACRYASAAAQCPIGRGLQQLPQKQTNPSKRRTAALASGKLLCRMFRRAKTRTKERGDTVGTIFGSHQFSRRHFCLCCVAGAAYAATNGWLTPREAFAEARGLVSLIKDSAAVSPITTHMLRDNISVLEGSGGNIAVLTGSDGKVLIDAGIGVSRPHITEALAALGADPVSHLINTHWHFDHADGNEWLHSVGAKIIAHENTRKHLSEIQRVEDWDYNFLPSPAGAIPSESSRPSAG